MKEERWTGRGCIEIINGKINEKMEICGCMTDGAPENLVTSKLKIEQKL
jgi:hypothetical protein